MTNDQEEMISSTVSDEPIKQTINELAEVLHGYSQKDKADLFSQVLFGEDPNLQSVAITFAYAQDTSETPVGFLFTREGRLGTLMNVVGQMTRFLSKVVSECREMLNIL